MFCNKDKFEKFLGAVISENIDRIRVCQLTGNHFWVQDVYEENGKYSILVMSSYGDIVNSSQTKFIYKIEDGFDGVFFLVRTFEDVRLNDEKINSLMPFVELLNKTIEGSGFYGVEDGELFYGMKVPLRGDEGLGYTQEIFEATLWAGSFLNFDLNDWIDQFQ